MRLAFIFGPAAAEYTACLMVHFVFCVERTAVQVSFKVIRS